MAINIKPSKRGSLRKALGVKEGENIPASKLSIKSTDSPAMKKKKQFAINARKWKHEYGGMINPMMVPYDFGGVLSTVGGLASGIPGVGGIVGTGLNLAGNLISGNKKKKEMERLQDLQNMQQNQATLTNMGTPEGGVTPGVVNPYVLAMGGKMNTLETYENGGLHEQNPLGGIPLSQAPNGKTNTVEEGEASFNFGDGKYVFSNRLGVIDEGDLYLPSSVNGKSFADAAKHIENLFKDRNSAIDISTKKSMMSRLRDAQENMKQQSMPENSNQFQFGGIPETNQPSYLDNTIQNITNPGGNYQINNNIQVPFSNNNEVAQTPENNQSNWWNKNQNNILQGVGLGLQAVPLITNEIAMNKLERPEKVQAQGIQQELQPHLVNRQQIERNLVRQLAGNRQALQASSSGNFGQYAANLQALNQGGANALANATLQAELADAQELGRVEQLNLQNQQYNQQMQLRADDINAQNQAAYQSQMDAYRQARGENISNIGKSIWNYTRSKDYVDSMGKIMQFLGLQNKNYGNQ